MTPPAPSEPPPSVRPAPSPAPVLAVLHAPPAAPVLSPARRPSSPRSSRRHAVRPSDPEPAPLGGAVVERGRRGGRRSGRGGRAPRKFLAGDPRPHAARRDLCVQRLRPVPRLVAGGVYSLRSHAPGGEVAKVRADDTGRGRRRRAHSGARRRRSWSRAPQPTLHAERRGGPGAGGADGGASRQRHPPLSPPPSRPPGSRKPRRCQARDRRRLATRCPRSRAASSRACRPGDRARRQRLDHLEVSPRAGRRAGPPEGRHRPRAGPLATSRRLEPERRRCLADARGRAQGLGRHDVGAPGVPGVHFEQAHTVDVDYRRILAAQ